MKTGAIVQARVSSQRLPGKILKELPFRGGVTVLEQVIRRLKKCTQLTDIIIATTVHKEDEAIVAVAKKEGVKYFRGSREDVLERYFGAAQDNKLDEVVRITSDCPCIDPAIVDEVISRHLAGKYDYTSNTLKGTYSIGLNAEIFSFRILKHIAAVAQEAYDREHVTPYIYRHPQEFKIQHVEAPKGLYDPDLRITLDTEQDYVLMCAIYDALYAKDNYFSAEMIMELVKQKPWLKLINKNVVQKRLFTSLDEELQEALQILSRQDMKQAEEWIRKKL